jgi:hypothetical protein
MARVAGTFQEPECGVPGLAILLGILIHLLRTGVEQGFKLR